MKKITFGFICFCLYSITLPAQNNTANKENAITFSSQQEKEVRVNQLEASYKINLTDPTYPASQLEKQKNELAEVRKAQIIVNKATKK